MPSWGGYGWLKGETTDPNDAAAGSKTGEGEEGEGKRVKNARRVEERIRDFSRPHLLTYVYLAAYLAMPLSIISCYLGEVLQPPFSRELSERASNPPSNNTTTTIIIADTTTTTGPSRHCTTLLALALRRRPRPRTYITRHRDKTRMDRYTARSMINNYSRVFIRCQTTVELPR